MAPQAHPANCSNDSDYRLLGFDIRSITGSIASWDASRRQLYLLRNDVPLPLSTDVLVWNSVIYSQAILDKSVWNNALGLLSDIAALQNYPKIFQANPDNTLWSIAITVQIEGMNSTENEFWSQIISETNPSVVQANWSFLGYDVSDTALISGLSNCGYKLSDHESLRRAWAHHLNEHHLFTDWRLASEFRILTNFRVPEHRPFFVYGLYRIDSMNS